MRPPPQANTTVHGHLVIQAGRINQPDLKLATSLLMSCGRRNQPSFPNQAREGTRGHIFIFTVPFRGMLSVLKASSLDCIAIASFTKLNVFNTICNSYLLFLVFIWGNENRVGGKYLSS